MLFGGKGINNLSLFKNLFFKGIYFLEVLGKFYNIFIIWIYGKILRNLVCY